MAHHLVSVVHKRIDDRASHGVIEIFQSDAAPGPQALAGICDALEEARIMLEAIVEPRILSAWHEA